MSRRVVRLSTQRRIGGFEYSMHRTYKTTDHVVFALVVKSDYHVRFTLHISGQESHIH